MIKLTGEETALFTHFVAKRMNDPVTTVVAGTEKCVPPQASTPSQIPEIVCYINILI